MRRENTLLKNEYRKALVPIILSVLGGTVNTMIDSMFVSHRLGAQGLAAINMCLPVFLFFCAIGSLLAGGACIHSSHLLGDGKTEESRSCYQMAMSCCGILCMVVMAAGLLCCKPLTYFLSQGSSLFEPVYQYCLISFVGTIPCVFLYFAAFYLHLERKFRSITIMMAITIGSDLLLDWAFLYLLDFGISGAAWASVISTGLCCAYGFFQLEHSDSKYRFAWKKPVFHQLLPVVKMGSPIAMVNLMEVIRMLLLNMIIYRAGGSYAVAVWAVLNALKELSICFLSGVAQAAVPLMGICFASKENSGLRILIQLQLKAGLFLCTVFCAVVLLGHGIVEQFFAIHANLLPALLCLGISLFLELLCSIWGKYFNVTKRILLANFLLLVRTIVFPVLFAGILGLVQGYLWLFLPIGSLCALAFTYEIIRIFRRRSENGQYLSALLLLNEKLEKQGKIREFSIHGKEKEITDAQEQLLEFCRENRMQEKQTERILITVEYVLGMLQADKQQMETIDCMLSVIDAEIEIRMRFGGEAWNPFEKTKESALYDMEIEKISELVKDIHYSYTMGLNTIQLLFENMPHART